MFILVINNASHLFFGKELIEINEYIGSIIIHGNQFRGFSKSDSFTNTPIYGQ